MPIVHIATNLGKALRAPFLRNVTSLVAEMTSKPEKVTQFWIELNYKISKHCNRYTIELSYNVIYRDAFQCCRIPP